MKSKPRLVLPQMARVIMNLVGIDVTSFTSRNFCAMNCGICLGFEHYSVDTRCNPPRVD